MVEFKSIRPKEEKKVSYFINIRRYRYSCQTSNFISVQQS